MWMSCNDRTNLPQWSKDGFTKMYVWSHSHSQSQWKAMLTSEAFMIFYLEKLVFFGCWCRNYTLDDQWKVHLIGGNIDKTRKDWDLIMFFTDLEVREN